MRLQRYENNVLREQWDDGTRTYTAYDEQGVQVSSRPYTAAEITQADARAVTVLEDANRRTIGQMLDQDFTDVQGVLAQTNADLRADPSQEIKIIGRVVRRLIRSERGDFTGTD